MKVKDLLYLTGGSNKITILDVINNEYTHGWSGIVDDIDCWNNIPFRERKIDYISVDRINGILIIVLEEEANENN